MLFCEDQYYNKNNAFRISVSFTLAIILHLALVYYTPQIHLQNKLSADILSLPTNVSVRFTTPPKPQQTIKKAPVAKPQTVEEKTPRIVPEKTVTKKVLAEKPQNLNRIEPAAAPPQTIDFEKDPPKQRQITNVHPADNIIPVVKEPNIKGRRVQPQYPKRALRMGQEGVVWVHVLIDKNGKRQDIKIYEPSQFALLNQAALEAVKKWNFDPSIVNGAAVKSWVEIPIEFRIQ